MLTATDELADHLEDPAWIVFDCRHDLTDGAKGRAQYQSGHVSGAFFAGVDLDMSGEKTGRNGRHPLPAPATFANFLARSGVTKSHRVVAYDDVGGQYAARLWWMARWIGFDNVSVLDGGWGKWNAEGRPVDQMMPVANPGELGVALRPERLATIEDVQSIVDGGAGLVVDARAPERYRGEVEPLDKVAGHIPGAVNHFFKRNLQADLSLRSPAELRADFGEILGRHAPQETVHQCGSGITACANLLAMEVAGLTGSQLYAGSWSEWSADPDRPKVTARS